MYVLVISMYVHVYQCMYMYLPVLSFFATPFLIQLVLYIVFRPALAQLESELGLELELHVGLGVLCIVLCRASPTTSTSAFHGRYWYFDTTANTSVDDSHKFTVIFLQLGLGLGLGIDT